MTSSVQQVTLDLALKQHNARLISLERSDGSNRWVAVNPEGGPDTDPEGPEFQNGWANVGAPFAPVQFKRFLNWTHIRGAFYGGSDDTVVFTLPELYWPLYPEAIIGSLADGSGGWTCLVGTDGTVTYVTQGAF